MTHIVRTQGFVGKEQMDENPLDTAKRLVRAVGRAFYSDEVVVMLEMLLRDRYLRDSTMDKRVGISAKLARRLLMELSAEHFLKTEDIQDEAGNKEAYYYIDFNHFTNVVRYRVHLMQKELERLEREANENQMYLCPQCNKRLPMLQVQSLRNKNFGFCCPACCPEVSHFECSNERLEMKPGGSEASYEQVQELREKLKKQMTQSEDFIAPHDGIYNLLKALEGKVLPSMLPSELMAVGVTAEEEAGGGGKRGGGGGGGRKKGELDPTASASIFEQLASATRNGGFMEDEEEEGEGQGNGQPKPAPAPRQAKATPAFLIGSRVIEEDRHVAMGGGGGQGAMPVVKQEQSVAAGVAQGMSEEERKDAYRRAFEAEMQKKLRDASPTKVKQEQAEEEEDMEWEEAEE